MRLSPFDLGFLVGESRATPMHVGGLYLFTLPEGVNEAEDLKARLDWFRNTEAWRVPFGHVVKLSPTGASWAADDELDVDYHIRHSALPKPGRYRELFALTARLHQQVLDRQRPLWEVHLIEGLQNRQFALYSKVHHAATDGMGAVRLAKQMFSTDPEEVLPHTPFSQAAAERARADRRRRRARATPSPRELKAVADVLREQFGVSRNLVKVLSQYVKAWWKPDEHRLTTAWNRSPTTSISAKITGARRFVAQSYALERVRAVGKALGGTVNDVVLAMCGGALRRFLLDRGELPDRPLTALNPVSLRGDDDSAGNVVGALTANLATHLADAGDRFALTQSSMNEGKALMRQLSPAEAVLFTELTAAPALLISGLGLGDRFPPFSTVVSNLPGPTQRSYWNGARLDGMYPVSAVYHGFALNFTLVSNADQLDFGMVACRRSLPSVQRIIDDLEVGLSELEAAAGIAVNQSSPR